MSIKLQILLNVRESVSWKSYQLICWTPCDDSDMKWLAVSLYVAGSCCCCCCCCCVQSARFCWRVFWWGIWDNVSFCHSLKVCIGNVSVWVGMCAVNCCIWLGEAGDSCRLCTLEITSDEKISFSYVEVRPLFATCQRSCSLQTCHPMTEDKPYSPRSGRGHRHYSPQRLARQSWLGSWHWLNTLNFSYGS